MFPVCVGGWFGNLWTLYILIKSDSPVLCDVKRYFIIIFISDFLFQCVAGLFSGIINLMAYFNDQNTLGIFSSSVICKLARYE